jgi:hypothetical protein
MGECGPTTTAEHVECCCGTQPCQVCLPRILAVSSTTLCYVRSMEKSHVAKTGRDIVALNCGVGYYPVVQKEFTMIGRLACLIAQRAFDKPAQG